MNNNILKTITKNYNILKFYTNFNFKIDIKL